MIQHFITIYLCTMYKHLPPYENQLQLCIILPIPSQDTLVNYLTSLYQAFLTFGLRKGVCEIVDAST